MLIDFIFSCFQLIIHLWGLPWKYKIIPLLIIIAMIVVLVYYFIQSRKPKPTIDHTTIPNTTNY